MTKSDAGANSGGPPELTGLAAETDIRSAALGYLALLGWSVVPLCPPDHYGVGRDHHRACTHKGKRPYFPTRPGDDRWADYQRRRADAAEVRAWFAAHPRLNVGVALGPVSGLVAVDVDHRDGDRRLADLSGGDIPPTLTYDTGRPDAYRLLYALPPFRPAATVSHRCPATGREVLKLMAGGTQVVLPPSAHPAGRAYRWRPGRGPGEVPLAPVPGWWPAGKAMGRAAAARGSGGGVVFREPGRNTALTSIAGAARKWGAGPDALLALLTAVNEGQCDPPLADDEVRKIANSVARYAPSPDPRVRLVVPPNTRTVFTPGGRTRG